MFEDYKYYYAKLRGVAGCYYGLQLNTFLKLGLTDIEKISGPYETFEDCVRDVEKKTLKYDNEKYYLVKDSEGYHCYRGYVINAFNSIYWIRLFSIAFHLFMFVKAYKL